MKAISKGNKKAPEHGRKPNQKLKSLLVYYYLKVHTDENHFAKGEEICAFLEEYGIAAERRSIYTDIEQLNKVLYMIEQDCSIEEAQADLEDAADCEKPVVYDKHHKGYRLVHSDYDFEMIRLLVESVYSARFIDNRQTENLIAVLCNMVSEFQADKLRHTVLNIDHTHTENTDVFFNVTCINEAMSTRLDGYSHIPEQISFKYMKYSINDMKQSVAQRGGRTLYVSPYQLIISDGRYYLRGYDEEKQDMRNYRVDRMKNVERTGIPRNGEKLAQNDDYATYTQRVFSMFGGEKVHVTLRFVNSLLDTVIDRFGKERSKYSKVDEHHFQIMTEVEISPQLFAWLCGFGTSVKILNPEKLRNKYKEYLKEIIEKL